MTEELKKIKQEFDSKLMEAQFKTYIEADPQQAGESSDLKRSMSVPFFIENFYVASDKSEKLIKEFEYQINKERKRNIVLYGYEGCGKTTFINYWMKRDDKRSIVLEFDKYISLYYSPNESVAA